MTKLNDLVAVLGSDPWNAFAAWFNQLSMQQVKNPNAVFLATVSTTSTPSLRTVLLKGFDRKQGFYFYTNYHSRKGKEIKKNNNVAALIYDAENERQIRIEGTIKTMNIQESNTYFQSRPHLSKVGAWASKQSQPLASITELEQRIKSIKKQFAKQEIPLPAHWGGYVLQPKYFEFWQGSAGRLHQRVTFTQQHNKWKIVRLYP